MAKTKQGPAKIRLSKAQHLQNPSNPQKKQQKTKRKPMAMSKFKTNSIKSHSMATPTHTPMRFNKKKLPRLQQQQRNKLLQQPLRRSLLVHKTLQPLIPPKMKNKKVKIRKTNCKNKATADSKIKASPGSPTQTLLLIKDSPRQPQSQQQKKKPLLPVRKQQLTLATNNKLNAVQKKLKFPQLTGSGDSATQKPFGYTNATPSPPATKHTAKTIELDVPLTNRLPIIDFISTDDFARMYSTKHRYSKRTPLDE